MTNPRQGDPHGIEGWARLRTQAERDADDCMLPERIGGPGGPLPPVPDHCYPADAVQLPAPPPRCGHVTFGALGGYKLVCVQTPGHRGPHQADNGARWSLIPPPADRSWIEMEYAPRRRWWHRYTRTRKD